jgi:toxin CcdB
MACFDIHRPDGQPVVDVQPDLLEPFGTRVVVPLIDRAHATRAPRRLNPVFEIDGRPLILATQLIAALPTAALGPSAGSLAHARDEIRAALDMLFLGF